ncbi:MAG: DUF4923 family protein [Duncaniella sp.]|nr:DUF4923 family protein [Duncaniella sp.]
MKKILFLLSLSLLLVSAPNANAQSARDVLGGLLGGGSSSSQGDGSGSSLGDIIGGVAGALGIGNKSVTVESMQGTWNYKAPAVDFKSDNLLLKAGGAAASSQVESKLATYYNMAGLNTLVLTVNPDSTFTMQARKVTVKGSIETNAEEGTTVFHFQALGKVNIGSMQAYIKLNGKNMELTFDVTKLMTLLERVGSLTNNSTIKAATTLLNQYDGMTAGFELTKQK